MSATDRIVSDNANYALPDGDGGLPSRPGRAIALVTCMDCRLDPATAFGLGLGDAHVLRNAGGMITDDTLRSLAISQRALGTQEVVLVHHTKCGMEGFDDDAFRAELTAESGAEPPWRVPGFADVRKDVSESLQRVRDCPWLPHREQVRGFVYDVTTGHLREVTD